MIRTILYAAIGMGLLACHPAQPANAADGLRLLATVAHQQAEAASEKAETTQQKSKKKRPVSRPLGDIKGESTDDKHAMEIDIQ